MKPFRRALEELGFTDVESYATSGNLLFNARASDPAALERRIAARVGTAAFVRTRTEMARVVAQDPLGAMIMFLAHPPTAAKRHSFLDLDFQEPYPVLRGRTVYFSFPLLLRGRRTPVDIERALTLRARSVPRAWRPRSSLACRIEQQDLDDVSPAPVRSRRLAADDSMSKKAMHFGATRAESAWCEGVRLTPSRTLRFTRSWTPFPGRTGGPRGGTPR
jgi:Protein of unknown function (DUF1697)